jgi:hypothetical protein
MGPEPDVDMIYLNKNFQEKHYFILEFLFFYMLNPKY